MLLVKALAGTGKTTTSVFGLGVKVPKGMILSDEQKDIVKAMRAMKWGSCAAMAFNKSIATVLDERLRGVPGVEAATSNAFGHRAWAKYIERNPKVDGYKSSKILKDLTHNMNWKDRQQLEGPVTNLVSLCKGHLLEPTVENLTALCEVYDEDISLLVFDWVAKVMSQSVREKDVIDFNDQLFMPIYYDIELPKFDMVLVDELQDLNLAKQELAFRMAKVAIVGVGDEHQAIYGFSGADSEAMGRFGKRMSVAGTEPSGPFGKYGYDELPLTITRRCPKAVVQVANKYVPEFRAADDAPQGSVWNSKESLFTDSLVNDENGRMVLCRTNAPLASLAFRLIARKRRCFIQGKDLGTGIKSEVTKTKETELYLAVGKARDNIAKKIADLQSKPFPNESRIESLNDRSICIGYIAENCSSVAEFCAYVDDLFKDKGNPSDIQLSSVHKAKGLEHKHVCIYKPSKLPLNIKPKKGKKGVGFQQQQECNLAYVAYTRSMDQLTFVEEDMKEGDDCE